MRLSIEVSPDHQVFVCADYEGLAHLRQLLERVDRVGQVHLYCPAWGGSDLTEELPSPDRTTVRHMKIYLSLDEEHVCTL